MNPAARAMTSHSSNPDYVPAMSYSPCKEVYFQVAGYYPFNVFHQHISYRISCLSTKCRSTQDQDCSIPNEKKFAESVESVRVSIWNGFFLGSIFVEPPTPLFLIRLNLYSTTGY